MTANTVFRKKIDLKIAVFWAVVGLFLGGYFVVLAWLRSNALWADDLDIVRVLQQTTAAPTLGQKVSLLFAQHNVHRVLTTRTLFLLLQETVGFRPIYAMYIGDGFYLGTLFIFYRLFKTKSRLSDVYFLPVVVVMLSTVNISNATWAMASVQNIAVQFFVVLAVYQLTVIRRWAWPVVWATAASFTSLTGFLTWGLIIVYLIYYKRFKATAIVTGIALLTYVLYKLGMEKAIEQDYARLFTSLPENIWYVLTFIGQLFLIKEPFMAVRGFYLDSILLVIFTAAVVSWLLYRMVRYVFIEKEQFDPTQESVFLYFFFLVICGIMSLVVTLNTEVNFFKSPTLFLPDRYVIHSLLFCCFFYVAMVQSSAYPRLVFILCIVTSLFLNVGHLYNYADHYFRQKEATKLDYYYLKNHGKFYSFLREEGYYIHCDDCLRDTFSPLERAGAVLFSAHRTSYSVVTKYPMKEGPALAEFAEEDYYYYKGLTIKLGGDAEFVMLRNDENTYILPTYRLKNSPRNVLKSLNYFQTQRLASIYMNKMKPGLYDVSVFSEKSEKSQQRTPYVVKVSGQNDFPEVSQKR